MKMQKENKNTIARLEKMLEEKERIIESSKSTEEYDRNIQIYKK
jgi:hypothetical protein